MANIKITELNGITKKASDDVLPIVDISANETKKIAVGDLLDKNVELIAVTDTEPAECSYGDKYYNTEDNLIYTAIANDTWGEDGEEPIEGIFYVVFGEQSSYAYNGTTLISVGGGTEDIIISPDQPTGDDWKLWIDKDEVINSGSEVVDSLEGNETNKAPSVHAVNNLHKYSTDEVRVGTWIDGKPIYRKTYKVTISSVGEIFNFFSNSIDTIWINFSHSFISQNKSTSEVKTIYYPLVYLTNLTGNYIRTNLQVRYVNNNWQYFAFMNTSYTDNVIGETAYITIEYTKTTD